MNHPSLMTLTVFERIFWEQGLSVAGTDEVGRGPLAGPVVAAAVILDPEQPIVGLDDSKRLSLSERCALYPLIQEHALSIGIGAVGPRTIERINILESSRLAMRRAIFHLHIPPQVVLSDAVSLSHAPYHTVALIRGDQRSASIAAASIVAKMIRDQYMIELHDRFPDYGFDQHKGYPTAQHREAIRQRGLTPAHRRTFIHGEQREG